VIYEGTRLAFALHQRAAIEEVALFFGNSLLRIPLRRFVFRVNLVPLGSYIKFNAEPQSANSAFRPFPCLSRSERLLLHASPLVAMGCIAICLLGSTQAGQRFREFWTIGIRDSMAPASDGAIAVRKFFDLLPAHPLVATGRLAVIFLALNIVQVFPSIVFTTFSDARPNLRGTAAARAFNVLMAFTLLTMSIFAFGWLAAVGHVVFSQ
jgi:hypothetical protein